jgi:hypothetical protein
VVVAPVVITAPPMPMAVVVQVVYYTDQILAYQLEVMQL